MPASRIAPIVERLRIAAEFAKKTERVERDEPSRALWYAVYPELSAGGYGLMGAVTSRAEAQVVRLSLLYALLDSSKQVRVDHLKAALAVWTYCEASAKAVFGDAFGDPVVDELLIELRRIPTGMTRTEIRDFFGRNRSSAEIDRALGALRARGLASSVKESDTGGRPPERWFAAVASIRTKVSALQSATMRHGRGRGRSSSRPICSGLGVKIRLRSCKRRVHQRYTARRSGLTD